MIENQDVVMRSFQCERCKSERSKHEKISLHNILTKLKSKHVDNSKGTLCGVYSECCGALRDSEIKRFEHSVRKYYWYMQTIIN